MQPTSRPFIRAMPGAFQLQEEAINVLASLNVLYFIGSDRIAQHVLTSEQVLNSVHHNGNRFPARFDVRHATDRLAQQAANAGLEGFFAFDVVVQQAGPDINIEFIECNPRPNGSTYYGMMAIGSASLARGLASTYQPHSARWPICRFRPAYFTTVSAVGAWPSSVGGPSGMASSASSWLATNTGSSGSSSSSRTFSDPELPSTPGKPTSSPGAYSSFLDSTATT